MKKQYKWLIMCLLLVAQFTGWSQPGGWSINTAQYQYSMTVVAQIKINGVPNHLLNNALAVYCQGQLRGYVTPLKNDVQAYYFLNLYSNIYKDEVLEFRAYIGSEQKMYVATTTQLFRHHKTLGKMVEPYQIELVLGERPLLYSLTEVDYVMGNCSDVLDVQASDNTNTEGNGLTYSIVGGADQSKLFIDAQTGLLSWLNFTPNANAPGDADGDNRYEVRVRVTDATNLTDEQLITITVQPSSPLPMLVCPENMTLNTGDDGLGNCTTTAFGTGVPVGTLCESNQITYQLTDATVGSGYGQLPLSQTFGRGVTTVQYTRAGTPSSDCQFTVTVLDNETLALTCPNNITRNTDANQCTALVSYVPVVSENCSYTITSTNGFPSGSAFPKGQTTIALKATDGAGNSAVCSFTVTVNDAQPPSITCPANIVRSADQGQCNAVVVYNNPTYSDNCPLTGPAGVSHLMGGLSGSTFLKGVSAVTWQATDGSGLTKTCSFNITVTDNQTPTITCPATQTRNTDPGLCSAVVTYPTPKGADNCGLAVGQPQWVSGGTMPTASGASSVATFQKGNTTVTWRTTDGGGLTRTCTFRVTVNDKEVPTMTCPPAMSVNTAPNVCNAVATYTNPTFTDNCAPLTGTSTRVSGLSSGATFPVGNTNVVFQATDAAGNTRRCTMVVTVVDNQPPVLTCPPNAVVIGTGIPCKGFAFFPNATAKDNCSGTLSTFLVSGLSSGSAFPAGITTNTFRAVAPNGQSGECTFTVDVDCSGFMAGNAGLEDRNKELEGNLAQKTNLGLTLAPNPAISFVTMNMEGVGVNGGTLMVFDPLGRLVQQQMIAHDQRTSTLQVAEFAIGLYRICLKTDDGMVTKTLVVVRA